MSPETYSLMLAWLESGTDAQKRHAAHRLAMPDAVDYRPEPGRMPPKLPPIPDNPIPTPGIRLGGCCGG